MAIEEGKEDRELEAMIYKRRNRVVHEGRTKKEKEGRNDRGEEPRF